MDTIADVKAVLDPVLMPLGFSWGQGDADDPDGQIIWCAAFDEFAAAFPWLPQSVPDFEPSGHECVDLIAELSGGHLVALNLEGPAVDETFRVIGQADDAAETTTILGRPAGAAGGALVPLLRRLFRQADVEDAQRVAEASGPV